MSKAQIIVKNLTQIYGLKSPFEQKALDNVSLEVNSGDFLAIIGTTGSGKSTLIQHLNALIKPTFGEIEILDFKIAANRRRMRKVKELRRRVGVVFQFAEYQIFESTIEREIIFGPKNFGISHKDAVERAAKYIEIVGLNKNMLEQSPFGLSGGQKRRVAIASVLSCEPDILVFDEPIAGLDPSGAYDILQILKKLNQAGKTIIMVTHNLDNALEYSNKTLIMKEAGIEYDDKTSKLLLNSNILEKSDLMQPQVTAFINELNRHNIFLPNNINDINSLAHGVTRLIKGDCPKTVKLNAKRTMKEHKIHLNKLKKPTVKKNK